jgi:hypothetical protein
LGGGASVRASSGCRLGRRLALPRFLPAPGRVSRSWWEPASPSHGRPAGRIHRPGRNDVRGTERVAHRDARSVMLPKMQAQMAMRLKSARDSTTPPERDPMAASRRHRLESTTCVSFSPRGAPARWFARINGCPSAFPHKSPQAPSSHHQTAPRRWRQRWIVAAVVGWRSISMVTWQLNNDAQVPELFYHIVRGSIKISQGCSLPSIFRASCLTSSAGHAITLLPLE